MNDPAKGARKEVIQLDSRLKPSSLKQKIEIRLAEEVMGVAAARSVTGASVARLFRMAAVAISAHAKMKSSRNSVPYLIGAVRTTNFRKASGVVESTTILPLSTEWA